MTPFYTNIPWVFTLPVALHITIRQLKSGGRKIGLLFLGNGFYNGKQIISSDFVKQTVNPSYKNASIASSNHSYGYLWWLFPDGYGCRGFGGQEVNVIPDSNFVSVIQATPTPSSKTYGDINENILRKAIL